MPDEKNQQPTPEGSADEPVAADEQAVEQQADSEPQQDAAGGEAPAPEESSPADPEEALKEIDDSADQADDAASETPSESEGGEDDEAAMMAMLEDLPEEDSKTSPEDIDFGSAEVSKAEFQQLQEPAESGQDKNIDLLMDVDLPVSIELGRTRMPIADILSLGPGSVVELNKLAGEPVDLMVNNKLVARGEVVVVDENFGLRITQLMTREERLKSLGKD